MISLLITELKTSTTRYFRNFPYYSVFFERLDNLESIAEVIHISRPAATIKYPIMYQLCSLPVYGRRGRLGGVVVVVIIGVVVVVIIGVVVVVVIFCGTVVVVDGTCVVVVVPTAPRTVVDVVVGVTTAPPPWWRRSVVGVTDVVGVTGIVVVGTISGIVVTVTGRLANTLGVKYVLPSQIIIAEAAIWTSSPFIDAAGTL
jgi:hypothetical protein